MSIKETMKKIGNDAKHVVDNTTYKVTKWAKENPMLVGTLVISVVGIGLSACKKAIECELSPTTRERRHIERTYYDPRTGLHWDLKRKASNEDRVAISEAIQNDADIYTVLSDRNLI